MNFRALAWWMAASLPAVLTAQTPLSTNSLPRSEDFASLERNGKRDASYVHDPSTIVRCKDEYWTFNTGFGLSSWRSKDLVRWERGPRVFEKSPDWTTNIVTRQRGNFWAPDVIFHNERYWLYYSVSQFGVNTSAIGLASNPTLDPADSNFHWADRGIVIETHKTNDFNAIDPQVIKTASGELWLAFGSFWSGIKLIQLDAKTGRLVREAPLRALAYHKDIEAAAIHHHDGWFYLFVNWGSCCRGVNSTYEIRVGRSREITGPYLDKDGKDLMKEGGTLLLSSDGAFIGPGHAGIFEEDGKSWFSCHFYDGTKRGAATLAIRPLQWGADGWPLLPAVAAARQSVANSSDTSPAGQSAAFFPGGTRKPLRIFIRSGPKTHGPGMHDHLKFLEDWTRLLNERGAKCEGGNQFPTEEQLARTDVLLIYCADGGDLNAEQRTLLTNFLARGGGLVTLLDGVCSHDPQWWKQIVGAAWEYNRTKWQYTKLTVRVRDASHPITAGAADFELDDEVYDGLHVIPEAHVLAECEFPLKAAAADAAPLKTIPQMWALQKENYRAFTWIQGLRVKTFSIPQYRALLLRGIAWAGKRTEANELCNPEELKALKQ